MSEADGKTRRPRVCVDLDGVLNLYDGWKGSDNWPPVRPGALDFLRILQENGHEVVVFTTRDPSKTRAWLMVFNLGAYVDDVTDKKLPAMAYVDDRAVRFDGDFQLALDEIQRRPHWKPDKPITEGGPPLTDEELQRAMSARPTEPWKGEVCKRCGRAQRIDWSVFDELWEAVVPEEFFEKTICLECFFQLADDGKVHVKREDFRRLSVVAPTMEDGGPGPVDRPIFIRT